MKNQHHIAFNDIISSLEENKNKIALSDRDGHKFTYGEFKKYITGTRSYLLQLGIKKGSKVLVFVTMSMELYTVLEALFSLGATTIFLDPWMGGRKMGGIIKTIEPEFLILNKKAAKYSWLIPATWKLPTWKIKELPANNDNWKIEEVQDEDSTLITFTSGSTGNPKGANRTYSFIDAQAKVLKEKLLGDQQEENIDYTNLPIVALAGFAIGNTVIIPRINLMQLGKADAMDIIDHLIDERVRRLVVSPALLKKVLIGIKKKGKGSIKSVYTGGSPISASLIKDCIENHKDIQFHTIYGSTEAEPICGCTMKSVYDKLNEPLKGIFVGAYDQNLAVRIVEHSVENMTSDYFVQHQLSEGSIGEIIICGNHVNKSYYKNQKAFERYKVIDKAGEIWHRTGDIGYMVGNEIYLVGRENRIMRNNNTKYYPFPLEQLIEQVHGLTDIGYIQSRTGLFILYIGSNHKIERGPLIKTIADANYPIDRIEFRKKALPRDLRHKSKLEISKLV